MPWNDGQTLATDVGSTDCVGNGNTFLGTQGHAVEDSLSVKSLKGVYRKALYGKTHLRATMLSDTGKRTSPHRSAWFICGPKGMEGRFDLRGYWFTWPQSLILLVTTW